ncbi:hypothetical protein QTL86_00130 [Cellulosilyticum sp. ST5]|uniref:hypothetical protein n=1 Tax=unclassified Cellulosilyticum TaxID=2643091 RepID=UPI000F8F2293|nr:hypothetical protein [Cellulosilyticum sp. WCF-2]QEH70521.1 hypothetical protein EKH84_19790 [Cellulosilyticum sp. WCF-2]
MRKWFASIILMAILITSSIGCGKVHITLGDNKSEEEKMEEEINKVLEDNSIDESLEEMQKGIDAVNGESEEEEQKEDIEETQQKEEKKDNSKTVTKKSIDDYSVDDYIYSEDDDMPYVEGEIEEVDLIAEIIQGMYSGDESYKEHLLTYESGEYIPITDEDIKAIEKELKLIRISLELTEKQKIDTKVFKVEYDGFATFEEEAGCHLTVGYYMYPEGADSYTYQFCAFDIIDVNGEMKAIYY